MDFRPKAWRPKINAAGSMLNVLSSINKGLPRSKYHDDDSPPFNFIHARINWISQSSPPPRFVTCPIFSPFLPNPSKEFTFADLSKDPKGGGRNASVSIRVIFDIKSCGDMRPESGCIIWPLAKGDQLLPVRCTFDLSVRDHLAWPTTPPR